MFKSISRTLLIIVTITISCMAQNEFTINVNQKDFDKKAEELLNVLDSMNKSTVVLLDNGCCNDFFYFTFKYYDSYPDWISDFLKSNNKFLITGDYKVPLITSLDYTLYYNKNLSDSLAYYRLDGTILGREDREILVLKNVRGQYGRLISKEELIDH